MRLLRSCPARLWKATEFSKSGTFWLSVQTLMRMFQTAKYSGALLAFLDVKNRKESDNSSYLQVTLPWCHQVVTSGSEMKDRLLLTAVGVARGLGCVPSHSSHRVTLRGPGGTHGGLLQERNPNLLHWAVNTSAFCSGERHYFYLPRLFVMQTCLKNWFATKCCQCLARKTCRNTREPQKLLPDSQLFPGHGASISGNAW